MEEQPVTVMRETTRNLLKLNRRFHRDEESDTRRGMPDISITQENIEAIIHNLKTKSSVSVSELQTLKNGLMEEPNTIELVLNTHGTLRGLVGELTGKQVRKQCEAAGCLCNLGLGDSKAGVALAKAAGPYLVAALDSLSVELAVTCAWAAGNIAGSGPRAAALLAAQGAAATLCHLVDTASVEVKDAALYALVHFGYQMKDELSPEHLTKILEALSKSDISVATSQLLFILSCHTEFNTIVSEDYLHKILLDLPISLQNHLSCEKNCSNDCKLLYQIRTLGNINVDRKIYELFTNCLTNNVESVKVLLAKEDDVSKSVLWLLGNLYNYSSNSMLFNELLRL